jgi:NADH:ubiquinone oxidoreductase subunit 5 (subunit L)/multisubunit Na+/H+ antiporter MnhA subunit
MDKIPQLLLVAWLLPLVSFAVICIGYSIPQMLGIRVRYSTQKLAGYIAVGAIVLACVLSMIAMFGYWLPERPIPPAAEHAAEHSEEHSEANAESDKMYKVLLTDGKTLSGSIAAEDSLRITFETSSGRQVVNRTDIQDIHPEVKAATAKSSNLQAGDYVIWRKGAAKASNAPPHYLADDWYSLGVFGNLKITIGYYIDLLTVTMFCMVTLIASCIHIYALGYMHDELHDYTDHEITMPNGEHFHRRGRFHRFFQYFSLFSFSMLGICIAGNLAMVFVFWELVGICSYFLIGFYFERKSASTAANKAFIVNRVGDFGMLIGLMALWSSLGTFSFGDTKNPDGSIKNQGIFSKLHEERNGYRIAPADGMIAAEAESEVAQTVQKGGDAAAVQARIEALRTDTEHHWGYWLLFVAGVGIFCGCVGKSAQFPLHVWLPDAMEGPTPVSALVHSATMVAAGVYLVGRCYPIFCAEALLVIAIIGCITLFLAATIAITAVDIKRVLAYSTVSQLGFMMLALGLGGWVAGLFHLITHAFFKSLLFLCSGSVIHAVHTNDMREMGGLRRKMPITAYTMLIGCLAIAGIGIPFVLGFSGFHSKDAIVEQAISFGQMNGGASWLFVVLPLLGALMTSFYMFRLWYMTFAGAPRDHHRYDHAHESPNVMTIPLMILAFFAVTVGWTIPEKFPAPFSRLGIENLLDQAKPVGLLGSKSGVLLPELRVPDEEIAHTPVVKVPAGWSAILVAVAGVLGATVVYVWEIVSAASLRRWLAALYHATWNKWWFDELYDWVFVRPTHAISRFIAIVVDRGIIDSILHACAWIYRGLAAFVSVVGDKLIIDNLVDTFAEKTWDTALAMRSIQTGRLRQYVMFIVFGTIVLFIVASLCWRYAVAG